MKILNLAECKIDSLSCLNKLHKLEKLNISRHICWFSICYKFLYTEILNLKNLKVLLSSFNYPCDGTLIGLDKLINLEELHIEINYNYGKLQYEQIQLLNNIAKFKMSYFKYL